MDAIVLRPGLQHEPLRLDLRDLESTEEVVQKLRVNPDHFLRITPETFAFFWCRLEVCEEEDIVGLHAFVLQGFGDLGGVLEEVDCDVLCVAG